MLMFSVMRRRGYIIGSDELVGHFTDGCKAKGGGGGRVTIVRSDELFRHCRDRRELLAAVCNVHVERQQLVQDWQKLSYQVWAQTPQDLQGGFQLTPEGRDCQLRVVQQMSDNCKVGDKEDSQQAESADRRCVLN